MTTVHNPPIPPRPAVTCGGAGGVNEQGGPCRQAVNLSPTTGLCVHHDPLRVDEARALARVGGVASGRAKRLQRIERMTTTPDNMPREEPDTLERLARWHRWVTRAVATGLIDARTAHEITCSLKELRPVLIQIGLEKRVRELEAELRRYKKRVGER